MAVGQRYRTITTTIQCETELKLDQLQFLIYLLSHPFLIYG